MSAIINNLSLIVNLMIGFAGLVCVVFIVIGGYRIASSSNDPQAYEGGKTTLKNALIGTVIVLFAVPAGNFFVSQVTSGTNTEAPQLVAQQSVGELEAPTITNVAKAGGATPVKGTLVVTFSEPVLVFQPLGVKIATSNIGALNLINATGSCNPVTAPTTAPTIPATGTLTLCFAATTAAAANINQQSRATQFIFGRGSSIRDIDDNTAVTAFAAISVN